MATKIYIAGKITGDPDYKAKFEAAAEAYKKKGYTVLCPSWMPAGMQPADYMRICFAMIDTADVVAFLPGFSKSPGARLEAEYCFYTDSVKTAPKRNAQYQKTRCQVERYLDDGNVPRHDLCILRHGICGYPFRQPESLHGSHHRVS